MNIFNKINYHEYPILNETFDQWNKGETYKNRNIRIDLFSKQSISGSGPLRKLVLKMIHIVKSLFSSIRYKLSTRYRDTFNQKGEEITERIYFLGSGFFEPMPADVQRHFPGKFAKEDIDYESLLNEH